MDKIKIKKGNFKFTIDIRNDEVFYFKVNRKWYYYDNSTDEQIFEKL